jgi:hypothetical protein
MPLEWVVEQLRASVFSGNPVTVTERDWEVITGQEEAEMRSAIAGGKVFSGSFLGGNLSLAYSGPRIDIILNAVLKADTGEPGLVSFGPWGEHPPRFKT